MVPLPVVNAPVTQVSPPPALAPQVAAAPRRKSTPLKTATQPVREVAALNTLPQDARDLRSRSVPHPMAAVTEPTLRQPQPIAEPTVDTEPLAGLSPTTAKSSRRTVPPPWVDNSQPLTAIEPTPLTPIPQPAAPQVAVAKPAAAPWRRCRRARDGRNRLLRRRTVNDSRCSSHRGGCNFRRSKISRWPRKSIRQPANASPFRARR